MAISYRIDAALGVVFKRVTDRVGPQDLVTHLRQLVADPDFRPGFHAFVDCRGAGMESSSADIRRMASEVRATGRALGTGRCAVLVTSDVQFGMMRVFEAFVGDSCMELRTFRAAGEASTWLEEVVGAPVPVE